jgi:hypothetical protein
MPAFLDRPLGSKITQVGCLLIRTGVTPLLDAGDGAELFNNSGHVLEKLLAIFFEKNMNH